MHQSRVNYQPQFKGTGFGWVCTLFCLFQFPFPEMLNLHLHIYVKIHSIAYFNTFKPKHSKHSDFETWHAEDGIPVPRSLSAVVLLSDNRAENGSLMVVPGSQNTFVGCVGETPRNAWETSLKDPLFFGTPSSHSLHKLVHDMGLGLQSCMAPAGSLLLFDSNLMHASTNNMSAFDRVNAFFAFTALSNAAGPIFTGAGRPEYLATRDASYTSTPMQPIPATWLADSLVKKRKEQDIYHDDLHSDDVKLVNRRKFRHDKTLVDPAPAGGQQHLVTK